MDDLLALVPCLAFFVLDAQVTYHKDELVSREDPEELAGDHRKLDCLCVVWRSHREKIAAEADAIAASKRHTNDEVDERKHVNRSTAVRFTPEHLDDGDNPVKEDNNINALRVAVPFLYGIQVQGFSSWLEDTDSNKEFPHNAEDHCAPPPNHVGWESSIALALL